MAGGKSKINLPNSHPSNPIHKKATQPEEKTPQKPQPEEQGDTGVWGLPHSETHENNKVAVVVTAIGAAALIYAFRS